MRSFLRLLLAAWLLLLAGIAAAQSPASKPLRILFVGNSLTYTTDIPKRLESLARHMGRHAVVESAAYPSFSLQDHWNDGRALRAIAKGWDLVVLQQGTSAGDEARAELLEYARRFARPIRDAGAKPALYMVWPLADRPREFPAVIESYRKAAEAIDAMLIPVGEAWLRVITKDKRVKLYSDAIHPSSLGSDLAVLTIYLSIFPAGHQEFDEGFVERLAEGLELPKARRDLFVDAATRAIDEPLALR